MTSRRAAGPEAVANTCATTQGTEAVARVPQTSTMPCAAAKLPNSFGASSRASIRE